MLYDRSKWRLVTLILVGVLMSACAGQGSVSAPESTTSSTATSTTESSASTETTISPEGPTGYPSEGRVISMIVPWAPGGAADLTARRIAPYLEEELDVIVQIVNQPGAGSQVGLSAFSQMTPDGYAIASTNLPITNALYLDPRREAVFNRDSFVPIANAVSNDVVLAVSADSSWTTIDEVADAVRAAPGEITYGAPGFLGNNHLAALQLEEAIGEAISLVQFEGGTPTITALLGGNIDMMFGLDSDVLPYVESGDLKVIATFTEEESRFYPGIPTAQSQGYDIVQSGTRGFSAPAETPAEIVEQLSGAFDAALSNPDLIDEMEEAGLTIRYMDHSTYATFWDDLDTEILPIVESVIAAES